MLLLTLHFQSAPQGTLLKTWWWIVKKRIVQKRKKDKHMQQNLRKIQKCVFFLTYNQWMKANNATAYG